MQRDVIVIALTGTSVFRELVLVWILGDTAVRSVRVSICTVLGQRVSGARAPERREEAHLPWGRGAEAPKSQCCWREAAPEAASIREGLWLERQAVRNCAGMETGSLRKSSPSYPAGEKHLPPPSSSPVYRGWSMTHRKGNVSL